tara:strand:- start:18 stop:494 length:477 start_codon:yes stop_codon:yes gene_type:complete
MSKKKKNLNAVENRRAKYNFEIEEIIEAGIILNGSEIKSIRSGKISIENGYASEKDEAMWLYNVNINLDHSVSMKDYDPLRPRKLLLKKKEISYFKKKIINQGITIIALNFHYNLKGFAKVDLGIAKGRKKADKREYKKEQDWKKQKSMLMKKKGILS